MDGRPCQAVRRHISDFAVATVSCPSPADTHVAATVIGQDRWNAGVTMMRVADPRSCAAWPIPRSSCATMPLTGNAPAQTSAMHHQPGKRRAPAQ
jgi:hypothetical protein